MDKVVEDLLGKSKKALEEYGRDIGIELDRRKTKDDLITQLEEHITVSYTHLPLPTLYSV